MDLQSAFQKIADEKLGPADFGRWLQETNEAYLIYFTKDLDVVAKAAYDAFKSHTRSDLVTLLSSLRYLTKDKEGKEVKVLAFKMYDVEVIMAKYYGPIIVSFTVEANQRWQNSGFYVGRGLEETLKYTSGKWTANPATGFVDANGNSSHQAKEGYTLKGANEGALIGRLVHLGAPTGEPFLIGNEYKFADHLEGDLELCINDDLTGEYGDGLKDNEGAITVELVSTYPA